MKIPTPIQLCRLAPLLAAMVGSSVVLAQDERWYRIELLVFAHTAESVDSNERWNPTPALAYPEYARFLIDPQRITGNLEMFEATSAVDDFGHQTLTIIPPPPEPEAGDEEDNEAEAEDEYAGELQIEAEVLPFEPNEAVATVDGEPAAQEILPLTPSPFTLLAHSELEFRGKAAYMQRTGRYQTLFHETWVQPMADQANTAAIVLDHSGDDNNWPLLQGSVKIFLSRYLHLETNLWLNTSGSYLPAYWQMPEAPRSPTSLTIIYPPEPEPDPNAPLLVIEDDFPIVEVEPALDLQGEELLPEEPVSPWRHAVLLQQKRRMRSNEVHYIDHPLLGLVIKISPLDEEELLQRAAAETAASQSEPAALNR